MSARKYAPKFIDTPNARSFDAEGAADSIECCGDVRRLAQCMLAERTRKLGARRANIAEILQRIRAIFRSTMFRYFYIFKLGETVCSVYFGIHDNFV